MGVFYPGPHLYLNDQDVTGIPNLLIQTIDIHKFPDRTMENYKLARAAGEVLVSNYFDTRKIQIKGSFVASSRTLMEVARDALGAMIMGTGIRLETDVAGSLRRFFVTLESSNIPETKGGLAAFELNFVAYDPFGYNPTATAVAMGTFTATPTTSSTINFAGSFDAVPVITATINTLTGAGAQSVTINNPATGIGTTVTRTWTAGDVLVVDLKNRIVTVNGVFVPWSGGVPSWPNGNGTVQWVDTFSARNVTWSLQYNPRYV